MFGRRAKVGRFVAATSFSLLTMLTAAGARAEGPKAQPVPLNPKYLQAQADKEAAKKAGTLSVKLAKGGHGLGRLPDRIDRSYLLTAAKKERAAAIEKNGVAVTYPSSYSLLSKMGPVKDQGNCGSCWDFAALASLESTQPKTVAFSENDILDSDGFDLGPNDGGIDSMSIAYLARWGGPKTETQYPYQYQWPWAPVANTSTATKAIHVQDVYMVPADPDDIKAAITNLKGSLTLAFWFDNQFYYQNAAYTVPSTATIASFYNPGAYGDTQTGGGHEVTVIGWDDNYPAANFSYTGNTPPGNGAYLCRNQWGAYWGVAGYFWISYYDQSIYPEAYFYQASPAGAYSQVYQYDPLGETSDWGYTDGAGNQLPDAWMANVFKADSQGSKIKAVGLYFRDLSMAYTISIYDNVKDTSDPTSGTLVETTSGTSLSAGYHTIKLPKAAPVTSDKNFSVVVSLHDNYGNGYPIAVEDQWWGYSYRAYANPEQSYLSYDGVNWGDFYYYDGYVDSNSNYIPYNGNICLKAYAGK